MTNNKLTGKEGANLLVELIKAHLEIHFDDIFKENLPKWQPLTKASKSKFLAAIGDKWRSEFLENQGENNDK